MGVYRITKGADPRDVLCPDCQHPKARHVKNLGCVACPFDPFRQKGSVCRSSFIFPGGESEREQAKKAYKGSYKNMDICETCGEVWMMHEGFLCPNGWTLFKNLKEGEEHKVIIQ